MNKKDFPDLEDQIKDTVKNVLDAIDFVPSKKNKKLNKKLMYISKKPAGRISGMIHIILGSMGIGVLSILFIVFFVIGFLDNFKVTAILLTLSGLNIAMILKGKSLRKRVKRFNQYVNTLNGENYCSIQQLAIATGKKKKFVAKDLRKMTDLGMFKEAYINEEKTYFMLSNEVYQNYLTSQENYKKRKEEELKKEKLNENINNPENEELVDTIEMVKNYIERIKNVSNTISNKEISIKLHRLKDIVSEIINFVEKNPKKLQEVRKFTTHYLPITLKLVNGYKELNDQPVEGDNIKNTKNEIEKSIDLINIAFEKLLDDLFEELALDVSTDISVLRTLFKQEGLTKNDFQK